MWDKMNTDIIRKILEKTFKGIEFIFRWAEMEINKA